VAPAAVGVRLPKARFLVLGAPVVEVVPTSVTFKVQVLAVIWPVMTSVPASVVWACEDRCTPRPAAMEAMSKLVWVRLKMVFMVKAPENGLGGLTHRFVPNSYISMGLNYIGLISVFYLLDEFFA
jgi:hypothetical protein